MQQFTQHNQALGTDVTLSLVSGAKTERLDILFKQLWLNIFQFEQRFSRFIPASELCAFNRSAGQHLKVSDEFRALLSSAKKWSATTAGLFNPLVLPALQRAGYKQSFVPKYTKDVQDNHTNKKVVDADSLIINTEYASIPYGTALDLGGIGKGYLADQLVKSIPKWITGYWFSLGGDVISGGLDPNGNAWEIQPLRKQFPATPRVAAATSGTTKRRWHVGGKIMHHIIDPRTRQPSASDINTATVYHKSATAADILATCAVILGSQNALSFLEKQGALAITLCGHNVKGPFTIHA